MESALPEDKIEEAYESKEEDWGSDPMNARNWPSGKKWRAVGVVSGVFLRIRVLRRTRNPVNQSLDWKAHTRIVDFAIHLRRTARQFYGRTWVAGNRKTI